MVPDPRDRRQERRLPVELKVRYRQLNAFFADFTCNICHGGAFIHTHRPLAVGTELLFHLGVPHLAEPLAIRGQVRWVRPAVSVDGGDVGPAEEPGMGIRFLYESAEQERHISELVERLMRESLGERISSELMLACHPGEPATEPPAK